MPKNNLQEGKCKGYQEQHEHVTLCKASLEIQRRTWKDSSAAVGDACASETEVDLSLASSLLRALFFASTWRKRLSIPSTCSFRIDGSLLRSL